MPDATTILMAHVARTLPKNLNERRALLEAMLTKMDRSHPAYGATRHHIAAIDSLKKLEEEAQLKFSELLKEDGR